MNDIAIIENTVYEVEAAFNQVCVDKTINFRREAEFAIQVISGNDYAIGIAKKNPQSVRDAVTNISAIGISLNPAKKQAYLVPRDGKICLDISYMGLIEIAVASGSIRWAKAELMRATDEFILNGFDRPPTHNYHPFDKDRGKVIGVYVVAKTLDGDYLTDTMLIDEVYEIRNRTSAWKAWLEKKRKNPWVTDEGEMIKKTVIKRAYKTWPRTDRLDTAVHYLNTDGGEGLEYGPEQEHTPATAVNFENAVREVQETADLPALEVAWKRYAEACRKAKDRRAYDKIKAAVVKRMTELKGQAVPEAAQ